MQITPQALGRVAVDILSRFRMGRLPGPFNAVTGDVLQDRMLFDVALALADRIGLRDRLGDTVFLRELRFRQADGMGERHRVGLSPAEAQFLAFLGGDSDSGLLRIQLPQMGEEELRLAPGDVLYLTAGTTWTLLQGQEASGLWLQLGYAKGSEPPLSTEEAKPTGIRLWGNPSGHLWQDLGLPSRGPNSAVVLPVTAVKVSQDDPDTLLVGRTDTLHDLRVRVVHGDASVLSPLHERLLLPIDGGDALFAPALDSTALGASKRSPALLLEWVGAPRIDAKTAGRLDETLATETGYLTRLAMTRRTLKGGEKERSAISLGDQLLLVRSGDVEIDGRILPAPACVFVPTGSFATIVPLSDAEVVEVRLERGDTVLAPQIAPSRAARVAFCIPMGPRTTSPNWDRAQLLLEGTLTSLLRQTDPNWIAVVVGTDTPEVRIVPDSRVHWLALTSNKTDGSRIAALRDAGQKRRLAEMRARELGADYICLLDSDDLMHPDMVKFVRETRHPYGYAIGSGFLVDFEKNDVAPYPYSAWGPSLDEISASTIVFNCQTLDGVNDAQELARSGHTRHRFLMHRMGRPLMEFPFRASVYLRFTSTNMSNTLAPGQTDSAMLFPELRAGIAQHSARNVPGLLEELGLDRLFAGRAETAPSIRPTRLSILVCTHKRPDGLAALLKGLVPQIAGHPEREIVVVNDGTHDAKYSHVIGQYGPAVRYVALPQSVGIAAARTRSAELARGDYLLFTDDDCEVPPWWVDWVDASLRCQPELDVVAGFTRPLRLESAGFVGKVQAAFNLLPRPYALGDIDMIFVTACLAIRAETFRRVGGFATGGSFAIAAEDTELALRLARSGARMRIDETWHVFHQLSRDAGAELRRFRRYGYGNRKLAEMPSRPQTYQYLRHLRTRHMPSRFVHHFRRNQSEAAKLKGGRWLRIAGRIFAALMLTAYDYGAASNRPR